MDMQIERLSARARAAAAVAPLGGRMNVRLDSSSMFRGEVGKVEFHRVAQRGRKLVAIFAVTLFRPGFNVERVVHVDSIPRA